MTTYTIPQNDMAPAASRPLFRKPNFQYRKDELHYLELEVKFYKQLLLMGIDNATTWCQPLLRDLLQEFSKIQEEELTIISHELAGLIKKQQVEPSLTTTFSQRIDHLNKKLKQLKTRFFPYIHELQALTIW
ncbi:MAG: hypothetical protein JNK77_06690 [Saprospiraceae bacterium]|nr:hypothetical protein [Saprospiraceae bacterium]